MGLDEKELVIYAIVMAVLGPYCSALGITEDGVRNGDLPVCPYVNNGTVLELKNFCDVNYKLTANELLNVLSQVDHSFISVNNASAVSYKINSVKEQKKKLVSKKKVKGVKNVKELLSKQFVAPVNRPTPGETEQTQSAYSTTCTYSGKDQLNSTIESNISTFESKAIQTDNSECDLSDTRHLNVLKYKISIEETKLKRLASEVKQMKHAAKSAQAVMGHYSVKNVNKRDNTARTNLNKLRDAQRTIIKQQKILKSKDNGETLSNLKENNEELKDKVERLAEDCATEKAKKVSLQKTNSYLKMELNSLRMQSNGFCECIETASVDCDILTKKHKLELSEKEKMINELEEEISELKIEKLETRDQKGAYMENIRLCVMELAGLEVAAEKMSSVIGVVIKHVTRKKLDKEDLPNATTAQTIIDEGHYLAKTYIAEKLETTTNWGLGRDGTTRKKQKVVDTAVMFDSGDVVSLGFTRVARETAETINSVTTDHLKEISNMKKNPDYLSTTLGKLAFTMSDRASNEKLADRLLDEWRDEMLTDYEGDIQQVYHFHCMAHVLLGFHNYVTPEIKQFEQTLREDTGPLGRDTLSVFNSWSKKETVIGRVIRTTSDTFGPAGDHLGVRDRWEAYCMEKGIKSLIGNYRDNRFNAIFQTAAEVYLHRSDFVSVLDTVAKPNLKLTAVKCDLASTQISALLQCLGLFYLKLTGPYWNLMTCGKVKYTELYQQVQGIENFLQKCAISPEHLFRKDEHWTTEDPLEISRVPQYKRLANILFMLKEETREVVLKLTPVVASAMLKCVHKQLADFLPGGQYHCPDFGKSTGFAPLTNLSCEHHFGDLDSSQKRRPHASFHHHSSIQLLKRNRKQLMEWIDTKNKSEKLELLTLARKGGKQLRKKHLEHDKGVLQDIHDNMVTEKANILKRKQKSFASNPKRMKKTQPNVEEFNCVEKVNINEYVAVAYQDEWYPGIVEDVHKDTVTVNFMSPCRKSGFYQWPSREDRQVVSNKFIIFGNFIPDCVSSGRQWFVSNFEKIDSLYGRFHAEFFC